MKIIVTHIVKKDVVKALQNTYGNSNLELVSADNTVLYDYKKEGWMKDLKERMKENLKKELKNEKTVYFLAVGFIPAVLIAYDVLKEMKKEIVVLNYNKEEEIYEEIEWR